MLVSLEGEQGGVGVGWGIHYIKLPHLSTVLFIIKFSKKGSVVF